MDEIENRNVLTGMIKTFLLAHFLGNFAEILDLPSPEHGGTKSNLSSRLHRENPVPEGRVLFVDARI